MSLAGLIVAQLRNFFSPDCLCPLFHNSMLIDLIVTLRSCEDTIYIYEYCKFGYFHEDFIFANSVKRHICDVKNSRLRRELHKPVNDRVISSFREDFIFTKLRICFAKNKTLVKISEFTVLITYHP